MKVERVNVLVPRKENMHRPYLYNELYQFMKKEQVGGIIATDYFKLLGLKETSLKFLEDLKIKFERVKK